MWGGVPMNIAHGVTYVYMFVDACVYADAYVYNYILVRMHMPYAYASVYTHDFVTIKGETQ